MNFPNPEEKRKADPEEPLLILNRLTSIQEILPVLSIISEVRSQNPDKQILFRDPFR